MTHELSALPASFPAGTTVKYRRVLRDYPAGDGWTLHLHMAGARVLTIVADPDGDDFAMTLGVTDTGGDFIPGVYRWVERVSKGAEVYEIASGTVTVERNLEIATDGSEQEWLERAINALKAHIEGRLPAGMDSYSIAGRAVSKMPVRDAVALLNSFEARLARKSNPGFVTRPVLTSFTPLGFDR